jgi:hypothetical protein
VARGSARHTGTVVAFAEAASVASGAGGRMSSIRDTRETCARASEIKFLIDPVVASSIREWARERMGPDPHGAGAFGDQYRTTSVYFDTTALDVFHRRGSFGRSKYRVRRYGQGDVAFLERKLRTSRLLVKRRTAVAIDAIGRLEDLDSRPGGPGYWFGRRLAARRLRAVCQVAYRRTAHVATITDRPVRLTLDDQIRVSPAADVAFASGADMPILERHMILELKFRFEMPAMFKQLLEEFALMPGSVSKYRMAAAALNLDWARPALPAFSAGVPAAV